MRYKVAPPVRSYTFLATARTAVPLVPDTEADCCRAIQQATSITDRERARTYLRFFEALGLVTESERGYHRTRTELDAETLSTAYRERVFLVAELLAAVEDGHKTPESAFEAVRDSVPRWERERRPDWERHWRARVEHLLGWAVLFGTLTVDDGRFEPRSQ